MRLIILGMIFALPFTVSAAVLFEGYMKIDLHGKQIGYVVQRDEVNDATKVRTVTYFVLKDTGGVKTEEGVKVTFKPGSVSAVAGYEYDQSYAADGKTSVDRTTAKAEGDKLKIDSYGLKPVADHESNTIDIPPGGVDSTMLTQFIAEDAAKYVKGFKGSFKALEEEDGQFEDLDVTIEDVKPVGDVKVAQIYIDAQAERSEGFTTMDGQPFANRDDSRDLEVYLVNRREEALKEFPAPASLKKLFGEVPRGLKNVVAESDGKINAKDVMRSFMTDAQRKNQPKKSGK